MQGRQLVPQVGLLKLQPQLRPSMRLGMGAVLRGQGDAKLTRIARMAELQVGWPRPFTARCCTGGLLAAGSTGSGSSTPQAGRGGGDMS